MNDESQGRIVQVAPPGDAFGRQIAYPAPPNMDWTQQAYGIGKDEDDERFDPLRLLLYIVRHRWLIVSIIALGLLAGLVVTLVQTPQYRAKSMLEVEPPSASAIKEFQAVSEIADLRTYKTALAKLQSREITQRVVNELGLAERADFLFPKGEFSPVNYIKRALGSRISTKMEDLSAEERERRAIRRVQENLGTKLLRGTSVISISYSSANPDIARQVANQFAASYIAQRLDQTSETSTLAREFVAERVADVKVKLQKSEQSLLDYAKAQGITITGDEGSLVSENIKAINEALSKAIQERLTNERLVEQIDAGKEQGLEQVIANENIQKNRSRIAELRGTYQQKRRTFKPDYPEMRALSGQIQELEKLLDQDVDAIVSGIRLQYQASIKKEEDLKKKLTELEGAQSEYQDKNIRYTILKREVDSYRSQYQNLIKKLNDLGVTSEIKNKSASIVEYAVTPYIPFSPSITKNLAIALAFSIFLTGGSIYIYELMNNTFSDPDQIEHELKLPVLGILPFVPESDFAKAQDDPRSSLSEAYRTLRTSIQFTGINGAPRSLLVTSTEPSEGKSQTSLSLAREFGALGLNVLLIDADLRRPTMHRRAGLPNTLGLSNLLTNTVPVESSQEDIEIMRSTQWDNVWMVTAGTLPPNPANLLASQKMGKFVEAALRRFDIVLIDSPPIIGLADALLLSRLTEATILVVSAHQVSRSSAKNARKKLQNAGAHIVGAALSKFKLDRLEYNYAYSYMNYGYIAYGPAGDKAHQAREPNDYGSSSSSPSGGRRFSLARLFGRHDNNNA